MAGPHFSKLDEESRALHESWHQIVLVLLRVSLVAALVWAVCSALRWAVHHASEALLEAAEHRAGWNRAVLLLAALGVGGFLRGWLVRRRGWDQAAGDGIDLALANYHITYDHAGDDPQPRYRLPAFGLAARKGTATFLTIGSGGSGGLEAPCVLIAESLAAGLSRLLRVASELELRTYQIAGISAAVATLLGAPFTEALFATEVAYGDRIIYRKVAYGLWAGVLAYLLNNRLHGYHPLFAGPTHEPVYSLAEYGAAALVAVVVSMPLALGFGWSMVKMKALVKRVRPQLHAVATALAAGLVALALWRLAGLRPSHVLGIGEQTLNAILSQHGEMSALSLLALALAGKMLTTGLTYSGGGSAGLLIPTMYLGGVSGALMAQAIRLAGGPELDPALFNVVGIGSSLVAVVGVPLSAIALVLEVFGPAFGPPAWPAA